MGLMLQPKLLRVLQEREFEPLGAERSQRVDVRVNAATNRDLRQLVADAKFQQDLYYRLNVIPIEIPPLRDRREDVPLLVEHFLGLYSKKYGKAARAVPAEVMAQLQAYDWPGNVRALRHAAERAVILAGDGDFTAEDFSLSRSLTPRSMAAPAPAPPPVPSAAAVLTSDLNLERAERHIVEQALKKHAYNISLAAQELGLTRASLYRRMEKHGL